MPIRCFTCGKVLGNKYEKFETYENKEQAFIELGITRYCCKRMLFTNIDTEKIFQEYTNFPDNIKLKQEKAFVVHNAR
jgi:DNA-directed RNA polymerase subunit N (RpoN/RPB10)